MADPGPEKDKAKKRLLAATKEPLPTRKNVAAARAPAPVAPADETPAPAAEPAADESDAEHEPE